MIGDVPRTSLPHLKSLFYLSIRPGDEESALIGFNGILGLEGGKAFDDAFVVKSVNSKVIPLEGKIDFPHGIHLPSLHSVIQSVS